MMIFHPYHKAIFAILRKKIKKNPYIGQKESNGTYLYKEGSYTIGYRIINLPEGKTHIEWLSHKRRLSGLEEKIRRIKQGFFKFWHYQKWLIFFRPPILLLLITGLILFYSEIMETQEVKMARLKWMIASATGISPNDVQYIGDGYLEISGERRRIEQKINEPPKYVYEPIKYTFNPLRWLFKSDTGFIKRWQSESSGYATHPVIYNDKGDIWFRKQDGWEHGRINGQTIKWDTAQVTGLSIKKATGHELSIQEKKLRIIDK